MNNDELVEEVMSLIEEKMEGEYWDFKEMHHENKASLLHDIICMANNRADRDAYIIFGVRNKDFEVVGIENDVNRRNQQQFLDFLKDKKFAGGIRPVIRLRTIKLLGKELDVLIIENKDDTPYYLVEDFRDKGKVVKAQYIYTRVGDSNTDITKGADINQVEYLWKKRFSLNRPPLEQIKKKLLNKSEWSQEENTYYNIFNPEYTIEIEENEMVPSKLEFYSYAMENEATIYKIVNIKSYETKLFSCQAVSLDSGRYFTTVPEWDYIKFDKYKRDLIYGFKFYIKDTVNYRLHDFFYDESDSDEEYAKNNFYDVVLFFKDEDEKENFMSYIYEKEERFKELVEENKEKYKHIECYDKTKEENIKKLSTGFTLNLMLNEFRNSAWEDKKKVIVNWSYPMLIDKIIDTEKAEGIGIYYISRKFGNTETLLYIGKTSNDFNARLWAHKEGWINNYRGSIYVRLGRIVFPKVYDDKLITDVESGIIYEMQPIQNTDKKGYYYCTNEHMIINTGFRGILPEKIDMMKH